MAIGIIDFLQTVQVEQQYGKWPAAAIGAFGLAFKNIQQAAIVGQSGEWVADREVADLFEKARVIEQRSTEGNRITHHAESLRDYEWRVHPALRLRRGQLGSEVHPGSDVDRAIEGREDRAQSAPVPDHGNEENHTGKQLLR